MSKVWFITGAGRGMGVDIAKAALAAGHKVVATGRNTDKVAQAVGKSADLLIVKLDVTKPADAESAVKASVDKFGRIDVLVNNAANFYAGFFEELSPEQMERQLSTSLIGPMNVTRAVLPVMRKQRSGLIITISSTAGLIGFEFGTAYAASKFGLEGWMQSLQAEIEPFGIDTITVNPGFFRTELLTEESTNFAERDDRGLQRAQSEANGILERLQRSAVWRPRQARTGTDYNFESGKAASPFHCRRRCCRHSRAGSCNASAADRLPTVSCPLPSHTTSRSEGTVTRLHSATLNIRGRAHRGRDV